MAINKVEANGRTLIDLTSDTVTADTLLSGRTAHLASGVPVTGTFEPVTGVKGNAESAYRKGNVNLTPANLGLGNVDNTSDANKPISTAAQAEFDKQQAQIDKALEQAGYNLFKITKFSNTVSNGITYTVNTATGIVTANGTVTSGSVSILSLYLESNVFGNLNLSGCANGGSSSTYDVLPFDVTTSARPTNWAGTAMADSVFSESDVKEVKFIQGHTNIIQIRIRSGVTVSNLQFKPMLTKPELAGMPFQPYAMSNMELTQKALIKEDDNAGGYVVDLDKDCKLQRNGNYIYLRNNSINIHADSSNINLQCGTTGSPLRGVSITSTAVRMYFGLNTLTVDEDGLWFNGTKIAE